MSNNVKTTVFNLIILDESGSMSGCTNATIGGCNEVINVAKSLQKKHADSQRSFMSIYAFQDGGPVHSRYLCKNADTLSAKTITNDDYQPWGNTPLYDAVGATLIDLKAVASTHEDATAVVTIITDGYENSSTHFDFRRVTKLISELKEMGWTFNFIGANIDVEEAASALGIDNRMSFVNDDEGTKEMFCQYSNSLSAFMEDRIEEEKSLSIAERIARRKEASKEFFKE
ncbi:MAG: hypothetical protein ACI30K_01930 [Muribaculaceae bacterium]